MPRLAWNPKSRLLIQALRYCTLHLASIFRLQIADRTYALLQCLCTLPTVPKQPQNAGFSRQKLKGGSMLTTEKVLSSEMLMQDLNAALQRFGSSGLLEGLSGERIGTSSIFQALSEKNSFGQVYTSLWRPW